MTDADSTFEVDEIIEYNNYGTWWPGIIAKTNDSDCGGAYLIFTALLDCNSKLSQCYTHRKLRYSLYTNDRRDDQIRKYTGLNSEVVEFISPIWTRVEKTKVHT